MEMVEITESNHHNLLYSLQVQSTDKFTYILSILFSYISNSCTSYLKGVTLHSCHSGYGPWCTTFSEGDHYDPGQTYEQRKEKGKEKGKTILSFPGEQFIFSKYR
jgi:hypothetical protein